MNDESRLEIELLFDGELPERDRDRLLDRLATDDPEARVHLDHLARLRDLALRHDPASSQPRRAITFATPRRRASSGSWAVAIGAAATATATAAAFAFLAWSRSSELGEGRPGVVAVREANPLLRPGAGTAPTGRFSSGVDRPPLEVKLYRWANTPTRVPGQEAARLVLAPGSASRKRPLADEILALELANASTEPRGHVRRFAVSEAPKPPPPRPAPHPAPASGPRTPRSDRRSAPSGQWSVVSGQLSTIDHRPSIISRIPIRSFGPSPLVSVFSPLPSDKATHR